MNLDEVSNIAQTTVKQTGGNTDRQYRNPLFRRPNYYSPARKVRNGQRPKKNKANPIQNRIFLGDDRWDDFLRYDDNSETESSSTTSSTTAIPNLDDLNFGYEDAFQL